jgi:prepilin-type N-terminal cleavage/methylation domain-containing protein
MTIKLQSQGFTLVELSIVIIIIGFLIAGISAGTSLMKQASLNTVIDEVAGYRAAFNNFRARFDSLPGDLSTGYAYFGSLPGANCTNNTVTIDRTGCNGTSEGYIEMHTEGQLAWKHLSLAGLITGTYEVNSTNEQIIGITIPASKYNNGTSGYHFADASPFESMSIMSGYKQGLFLQIGAFTSGDRAATNVFTAADAENIDRKIDDGAPNSGVVHGGTLVFGYPPNGGGWADDCSDDGDNYLVQNSGIICRLGFAFTYK